MERLVILGGTKLQGTVKISGAKNAVLPILAATLLAEGPSTINEVPDLADVQTFKSVLTRLGANLQQHGNSLTVEVKEITGYEAPYEYVRKMRASFLVMGPLLARVGRTRISMPGGCAIGTRPIDLHLKGFAAMGAEIISGHGYVEASAKRLQGCKLYLDFPSVGATENILMAAVLANGKTILENAAEEPEVVDLVNYLNAMGARIRGAGTKVIIIEGVKCLTGTTHNVIPDRIEAGTFMVAGAITGGDIIIENVLTSHLGPVIAKLRESGARIEEQDNGLRVQGPDILQPIDIKTLPYPGYPTDMQAQMMALASVAMGTSVFTETIFENRFMHVDELRRMGAKIKVEGRQAVIEGVHQLTGAPVMATDLRAGAALILAGLVAKGQTEITNLHHLDRGYEYLQGKFSGIGAQIVREQIY